MDYRPKVTGPENAYTVKALRNIQVLAQQPLALSLENFVPAMLREITQIYPQKAAYVGAEGIDGLIREGVNRAQSHLFSRVREIGLAYRADAGFRPRLRRHSALSLDRPNTAGRSHYRL